MENTAGHSFLKIPSDFFSKKTCCRGDLYLPEGKPNPPIVVMAHGFGAERTFGLPAYAETFAQNGLAAYLFSENIGRTWRVAESFEAGAVGVNTTDVVSEVLPFGGWKESGLGRENGVHGSLDAYCETKSLIIAGIQK